MFNTHYALRGLCAVGVALVLALSLQGCDPGFSYRPDTWESQAEGYKWVKNFGDTEVRTWGIDGLIASESIVPEFEVTNNNSYSLILEEAKLLAEGEILPGEFPGKGEARWRTVSPGATQRILLQWTFAEPAARALGSKPNVILKFSGGPHPLEINIVYTRLD